MNTSGDQMTPVELKDLVGRSIIGIGYHGAHGAVYELHLDDGTTVITTMSDYTKDIYFKRVPSK